MNGTVLLVDDEPRLLKALSTALGRSGHHTVTAGSGEQALLTVDGGGVELVVTDWKMPGMDGLELLRELKRRHPELPVILMTAHADVPSAVAAMREGAFDYVTKPFDNEELRALVARALEVGELTRENRYLRAELAGRNAPSTFVTESPRMRDVLAMVARVAKSKAPVLIQGDSGTGKERIARLLHFSSDRVAGPFVAVNCKAFAEGVLESELFGHERGAFTGAESARAGCFERASRGTLFLDEIGEISLGFQAKLLRAIQEGEVQPIGAGSPRKVDVRLVAATNRNLREEVAAGRFREDLYFRIQVIPIHLPPLRERREDVLPLARHFLARHGQEQGRRLTLSADAEAALTAHPWPGNVRELENALERAAVLATSDRIEPEDLLLEAPLAPPSTPGTGSLQEQLDRATRAAIEAALAEVGGQRAEAAKRLGIERTTLYRLMKRLEIEG